MRERQTVFTVQMLTSVGWVNVPYMTYPSRSTAYRYAANRRIAYPMTEVRVVVSDPSASL